MASDGPTLKSGDTLGFRMRPGDARSPVIAGAGGDTFKVEARALGAQQKEAVLTEGATGSLWRLTADEGPGMRGHDVAPFPLGYLIAGVASDLYNRVRTVAAKRGAALGEVEISMSHRFGAEGSFIQSTAKASSEATDIQIALRGDIDAPIARAVVAEALVTSPAVAFLRTPMPPSTFALYLNGRRRTIIAGPDAVTTAVTDPFLAYGGPPRQDSDASITDLIQKPGIAEQGDAPQLPLVTATKRLMTITGTGRALPNGEFLTETWIARPGMSHFRFLSDERGADTAPSGLGLLSAGIAFCYLTQLHRYIDAQKLEIQRPRLVQFTPFVSEDHAQAGAIDTHLFLSGDAPEDEHINLLAMAANTCFMHAAAAGSVEPNIVLSLNGKRLGA